MRKFAVLDFMYNGDQFAPLVNQLDGAGVYTVNVGDNIQSIAVNALYKRIGINNNNIISINRDTLQDYDGEQAFLIMNGCFYQDSFPLSIKVTPIFIGFNTSEQVIIKNKHFFKKHEPIGCRDRATTLAFRQHNIDAFTTGCLTLTLPTRLDGPVRQKVFIVYGQGAGALPDSLIAHIPLDILNRAEFVFQRLPVSVYPLSIRESSQASDYARKLLLRYESEADMVITPLLHAASPCLAMGIPVILARNDVNDRFTAIDRITKVYIPRNFDSICWNPSALSIENIKFHLDRLVECTIFNLSDKAEHINVLHKIFDCSLAVV